MVPIAILLSSKKWWKPGKIPQEEEHMMLGQLEKTTILSMSRSHLLLFNVKKKYLRGKKKILGSSLYFKCKSYHNQLFLAFA